MEIESPEESNDRYITAGEWFDGLEELAKSGTRSDEVSEYLQSMPAHLKAIRDFEKGMVVVPDAEHMTEAMIDASRGLHLYYTEAGAGVMCSHMRKHLMRYAPWTEKHWPQWFREDTSHLTKAGRAIVAHAVTIGAWQDPDARAEYFKESESRPRVKRWEEIEYQHIRLTFTSTVDDCRFTLNVPFISANRGMGQPGNDDQYDPQQYYQLQLNRNDIPKPYRKEFRQAAVLVQMRVDGEPRAVTFETIDIRTKDGRQTWDVIPKMMQRV